MAQFDYQRIKAEVHDYCRMADFHTFAEEGIVAARRELADVNDCCITAIDDVDADTWEDLLEVFDTATITAIA